jgi:hypothetical protein
MKSTTKRFDVGQKVTVSASHGIGEARVFEGVVTYNDPKSPYIKVNGYEYRKYEVARG